jgi:dipeptidyl-peptidase-3
MRSRLAASLLLLFACCQSQDSHRDGAPDTRRWELDRIGGTAVVQLYADGFGELAKNDKLLAFHLTQAAIAGRDITLDQRFALNLPIRYVLESLWLTRDALPPEVRAEVERYTKLFWVHNGIHHNLSTKKELLALDHAQFFAAIKTAAEHGQPIPP